MDWGGAFLLEHAMCLACSAVFDSLFTFAKFGFKFAGISIGSFKSWILFPIPMWVFFLLNPVPAKKLVPGNSRRKSFFFRFFAVKHER